MVIFIGLSIYPIERGHYVKNTFNFDRTLIGTICCCQVK